jgi:putative NIF3 family GTP cyclohydrolase 1 type 2
VTDLTLTRLAFTAGNVRDLVFARCGVDPTVCTNDVFHAGSDDTPVTGIVTTFQATVPVIRRAIDLGASLIITHEPTFWIEQEEFQRRLNDDPVRRAKEQLCRDAGLAIWRCHDALHRNVHGDDISLGVEQRLGWRDLRMGQEPGLYRFGAAPLRHLAQTVAKALHSTTARYVGDPELPCSTVAFCLGAHWSISQIEALSRGADVVICGESREWETPEYVRDAVALGLAKSLLLTGHAASEEAGMDYLGRALAPLLPGVAIHHIPCGEPFHHGA